MTFDEAMTKLAMDRIPPGAMLLKVEHEVDEGWSGCSTCGYGRDGTCCVTAHYFHPDGYHTDIADASVESWKYDNFGALLGALFTVSSEKS